MDRAAFIDGVTSALIAARSSGRLARRTQIVMTEVMYDLMADREFLFRAQQASESVVARARARAEIDGFDAAIRSTFAAGVARGVAAGAAALEDAEWV